MPSIFFQKCGRQRPNLNTKYVGNVTAYAQCIFKTLIRQTAQTSVPKMQTKYKLKNWPAGLELFIFINEKKLFPGLEEIYIQRSSKFLKIIILNARTKKNSNKSCTSCKYLNLTLSITERRLRGHFYNQLNRTKRFTILIIIIILNAL